MRTVDESQCIRFENITGLRIPIVNLVGTRHLSRVEKKDFAMQLGKVCQDIGFFYVENHGLSDDFLVHIEEQIHAFFDLPMNEKMKIHISKSPYHRGYVPNGEESALTSELKDVKEVFDMALELALDDPDVIAQKFFHGPNAWPEALPTFKPAMLKLYEEWRALGGELASHFATALGLPSDYFVDKTDKPLAQLRIAKYPPQRIDDECIGCGAHTDYSVVSFIWQVDVPGLQIKTREGRWCNAPKIPGTFVCLLGDAIAMWTNDYWPATVHRVINNADVVRYSAAFFFDPNDECEIFALNKFVSSSRPARYLPTTMGQHVRRGFDGTFEYRSELTKAISQ